MRLAYRLYRRPFRQPLRTAHGPWTVRQGILLRSGGETVRFGEIAPLPWFGTETLEAALAFCQTLAIAPPDAPPDTPPDTPPDWPGPMPVPAELPACQFGVAALALETIAPLPTSPAACCGLLPTGAAALTAWPSLWQQGHRTLKWKIGVAEIRAELALLEVLMAALPETGWLRLDANGGLTPAAARRWLARCDRYGNRPRGPRIEFLEQPLPPPQFDDLMTLSRQFKTPLALDESVATYRDLALAQKRGWPGVFVVKPAIAGNPEQLVQMCRQTPLDLVFSSVFETAIGLGTILALAERIYGLTAAAYPRRALGLGTAAWFGDGWDRLSPEQIWTRLDPAAGGASEP